jgi:hypothetical protein
MERGAPCVDPRAWENDFIDSPRVSRFTVLPVSVAECRFTDGNRLPGLRDSLSD